MLAAFVHLHFPTGSIPYYLDVATGTGINIILAVSLTW